ncbi:MAG TPA: ROK family protein [Vicinamibacterales bacterium]|nr:ROK family protein [Vicinamibacterales bacterium]
MRLGIDLGGTKTAAIVLADDGRTVWESRRPTPRDDYSGTIEAIAELVAEGERAGGTACTVGIGMPGAISPATGRVKNANSTWLNGQPLKHDLERRLAREVRLQNDANCLAVSEATDGAAAGAEVVFAVILGTGCGGGVAVRGRVLTGANAISGEWGHNPLPAPEDDERPGPECYCGRRGCIETFLSGPGLSHSFRGQSGREARGEEVAALAVSGDAAARAVLDRWTVRLARALAGVINILDPNVIVVGGGLSRLQHIYKDVPARWNQWIFSDAVTTRLVPAKYGDASGVRGAAWLWPAASSKFEV